MSQSQVDGTNSVLSAWPDDSDLRFVAYALGTALWETDHTMQPIREIGQGRGHVYGEPAGPYNQVYYGRGFVQLTWQRNYELADTKLSAIGVLKPDENLVATPDLALRPDIAAEIMVRGMVEGWFTGASLSHYFTPALADWVNARRIINGTDHAAQIGAIASHFWHALKGD